MQHERRFVSLVFVFCRLHLCSDVCSNAVFDSSGSFIIFATLFGIKIVNLVTGRLQVTHSLIASRRTAEPYAFSQTILGKRENSERFLHLALYQVKFSRTRTAPTHSLINTLPFQGRPKAAGSYDEPTIDPAIFCTAFRRNRFYIFSRREPARCVVSSLHCPDARRMMPFLQ